MLKKILRDIRAVGGVTGVTLLRKRDSYTESIFPAAFTEEHAELLHGVLIGVYRHLRGFSRIQLTFERTTVFLFARPEFLLLVTTLPGLDKHMFEMVVNSKFATLERALDTIPVSDKDGQSRKPVADVGEPSLQAILGAMNRFSADLLTECGRAKVSQYWREARSKTAQQYAFLSSLAIDPNCRWSVRKGQKLTASATTSRGLAEMTDHFVNRFGSFKPVAREMLFSVVQRDEKRLEESGYLHFLKTINPNRTPANK